MANRKKAKKDVGIPTSSVFFYFVLLFLGVISVVLIEKAGSDHQASRDRAIRAAITNIQSRDKKLSAISADSIRVDLEEWDEVANRHPLRETLLRDIGIAVLSTVILALFIELYARSRLQDEVRSGVVEAAFKRLIPEELFDQVRTHVIGANLIKDEWTIEMQVRSDPEITQAYPDLLVSRTTIKYVARRLTKERSVKHRVGVRLDQDHVFDDGKLKLPRFIEVTVGDDNFSGARLEECLKGNNGCLFEETVTVKDPVPVTIVVDELLSVPDTFDWCTTIPTSSAALTINASSVDWVRFEVTARHSDGDELAVRVKGQSWELPLALLPWQGFNIRSYRDGQELRHTPNRPFAAIAAPIAPAGFLTEKAKEA